MEILGDSLGVWIWKNVRIPRLWNTNFLSVFDSYIAQLINALYTTQY